MNGHHVFCNGHPNSPVETCKWCSGPEGLLAKYPEDCSPDELVKKYFPNAISRDEYTGEIPFEKFMNFTRIRGDSMSSESIHVEYIVRVKLPPLNDNDDNYEYERRYNDAIFAVKPTGFEVDWSSKKTWPVDSEGYTWVKLYCTDQKKAVEYFMDRVQSLEKRLEYMRDLGRKMADG